MNSTPCTWRTIETDSRHTYVDRDDRAPYTSGSGERRVHVRCSTCGNVSSRAQGESAHLSTGPAVLSDGMPLTVALALLSSDTDRANDVGTSVESYAAMQRESVLLGIARQADPGALLVLDDDGATPLGWTPALPL